MQAGRLHHKQLWIPAKLTGFPMFEFTDPRKTPFVEPRSRGHLPHLYKECGSYFVTIRLWDAVVSKEWTDNSRRASPGQATGKKNRDEILAESEPPLRLGSCLLMREEVAELVQNALKHFHGDRYHLHSWCIMPNHIHAVYSVLGQRTPEDIHHSWKSYTAHKVNELLSRTGTFWESESFDHLIRSVDDLEWFVAYTEGNPVAAGLCGRREEWPWSSAGIGWQPS